MIKLIHMVELRVRGPASRAIAVTTKSSAVTTVSFGSIHTDRIVVMEYQLHFIEPSPSPFVHNVNDTHLAEVGGDRSRVRLLEEYCMEEAT